MDMFLFWSYFVLALVLIATSKFLSEVFFDFILSVLIRFHLNDLWFFKIDKRNKKVYVNFARSFMVLFGVFLFVFSVWFLV